MTEFVRLIKKTDKTEEQINYGIIPFGTGIPSGPVRRHDPSKAYPAGSFIVRDGVVYHAPMAVAAGPWDFAVWNRTEDIYAFVQPFDFEQTYKADSIVLHPRTDEPVYTLTDQVPGNFVPEAWGDFTTSGIAKTLWCYLDPTSDLEEATSISGYCVQIIDEPIGEDSYLASLDGLYLGTNRSDMALNPDGTGEVFDGERVMWLRDLTGKGNHAIQTDPNLAPRFKATSSGGYLVFSPGCYMVVPELVLPTNHYVSVGGRGEAIFLGVDNDANVVKGARIGIKNQTGEKYWNWGGEAVTRSYLKDDVYDKVIEVLETATAAGEGALSPIGGMFEDEDRLYMLNPGFNTEGMSLAKTFKNCVQFRGGIAGWDVSGITNLIETFYNCRYFDEDLSNWNTSSVELMTSTFEGAFSFNQDLTNWNTSNVTGFSRMFANAISFNNGDRPMSDFVYVNAENIEHMFFGADKFNQDVSRWDTTNVTNMKGTFRNAKSFNQDLSTWVFNLVEDADYMFTGAVMFEQDISTWCADLIPSLPVEFDAGAGFEGAAALQPQWGGCP